MKAEGTSRSTANANARGQSRPSKGTFDREAHRVEQETDQDGRVRLGAIAGEKPTLNPGPPLNLHIMPIQCKQLFSCGAERPAVLDEQHPILICLFSLQGAPRRISSHTNSALTVATEDHDSQGHWAAGRQTPPADHFTSSRMGNTDWIAKLKVQLPWRSTPIIPPYKAPTAHCSACKQCLPVLRLLSCVCTTNFVGR